jgi:ubiquinone/menaquinone biosynthesis C-methylase UbiE
MLTTRAGTELLAARRWLRPRLFDSFYVSRFVGTQLVALRALLHTLPGDGPLLSLCCGHGVFEMLAHARAPRAEIVSIDGQLINLLVTQRFVHREGDYLCHDVQFALPFSDGAFAGTFNSSSFGEFPSQADFVRESIRVTRTGGWTMFDAVQSNDHRVSPLRYYRFCQNHFARLEDYGELMGELAGDRPITVLVEDERSFSRAASALVGRQRASFIIGGEPAPLEPLPAFTSGERDRLFWNPLSRVEPARARPADDDHLRRLYETGAVVMLPEDFAREMVRVGSSRATPSLA